MFVFLNCKCRLLQNVEIYRTANYKRAEDPKWKEIAILDYIW